ncbi:hypothetical protein OQA88_11716 [Cercophora sp. LCS_1]
MIHQRLALGAALALSLVGATVATDPFGFASCVSNCVKSSGCESQSAKCVCKEAKDDFLEDVVVCLYYHCQQDLRDVGDVFFIPVKSGCEAAKTPIPKDNVREAEKEAASYIAKLPKTTAKDTQATKAPPVPVKTLTTTSSSSTATQTTASRSSWSSSSANTSEVPAPTRVVAPPPLPPPPSSTDSPTTTANAPGRVPTDSSPFATFNSAGSRVKTGWIALPLLLAMFLK